MRFPKIAVVGSREYPDRTAIDRFVYIMPKRWTVVSGGARGVDKWAEETAKHWRRPTKIFNAQWNKYGPKAGFIRNNDIVRYCDIVVAFWDGESKGTKHTIQLADYLGKPCIIVRPK